ncbi:MULTISPECIES: OmpW family outer membrane protein [unclassified Microbulbifer]|uniref:OmpW/AlkL family protein n=1 Tax=unclassified Microbulbifer TaxID=2619833 RepID=UPI0027E59018|nr:MULTISPECIES: OmpW family outer membrane protein [unclassified Microbulbifer]
MMRLKFLLVCVAAAACAGLVAQAALADYKEGDIIIRGGASFVEPDDDQIISRRIPFLVEEDVEDDPATVNVLGTVDMDLDDDTTWYVSGVWLFRDHWGLELHHVNDASLEADLDTFAIAGGSVVGSARVGLGNFDIHVTSLFINWYPLDPSCLIQPYVGLGVNYTDIDRGPNFKQVRSVFGSGATFANGILNLGSDFGGAAQVGVDFLLGYDSNWIVNASAIYADSEPDLELGYGLPVTGLPAPFPASTTVPVRISGDFDYSPWMLNLGVGYKFIF